MAKKASLKASVFDIRLKPRVTQSYLNVTLLEADDPLAPLNNEESHVIGNLIASNGVYRNTHTDCLTELFSGGVQPIPISQTSMLVEQQ